MRVLHRQSEGFDERNLFLQVALGLLSLGGRLETLLGVSASVGAGTRDARAHGAPDPAELALLGAIATSARLRQRLADAVPGPVCEGPSAVAYGSPPPDALRRWLR
jgi:hypothetical protein